MSEAAARKQTAEETAAEVAGSAAAAFRRAWQLRPGGLDEDAFTAAQRSFALAGAGGRLVEVGVELCVQSRSRSRSSAVELRAGG